MSFTDKQKKSLDAPLARSNVKQRKNYGGGPELSYIEAWVAIAEANRIFGFDGWSRETTKIERVATTPYQNQKNGNQMISVSYMARVRVTAGGVTREGCGYGDGQAKASQAGTAHELALKEAESDAMKRALMTFGNPFGLALYDKTQSNVVDIGNRLPKAKSRETFDALVNAVRKLETVGDVEKWERGSRVQAAISQLPLDWEDSIITEIAKHKSSLADKIAS